MFEQFSSIYGILTFINYNILYIQMQKERSQLQHQDGQYQGNHNEANYEYQQQKLDQLQSKLLPALYKFRSSQQIEHNVPINQQHISHQPQKQCNQSLPEQGKNWLVQCIGLILCSHYQNNQLFYVYGTGTVIYNNLVLTSAQNVYCRRLNKRYSNIKFIIGVDGDKCSSIYNVEQIYYQHKYTQQECKNYKDYDFAVLQLQQQLTDNDGDIGWKTVNKKIENSQIFSYQYVRNSKQGSFSLQQIAINKKSVFYTGRCSGSGIFLKEEQSKYCLIGLNNRPNINDYFLLSEKIRYMINQMKEVGHIDTYYRNLNVQEIKLISFKKMPHLTTLNLVDNNVDAQGCKYLSQANWPRLNTIKLSSNYICAQGCKYLSHANWIFMTQINLERNNIGAQGCKYLSQANWKHLTTICLNMNNIGAEGCQYLSQANWKQLTTINLNQNQIGVQGCRYLIQADWIYLNRIDLARNRIDAQGCKYLSQTNWISLTNIQLYKNKIDAQGCRYISQFSSKSQSQINLYSNKIDAEGCKYLAQSNWSNLEFLTLQYNPIRNQNEQIILKQLCCCVRYYN